MKRLLLLLALAPLLAARAEAPATNAPANPSVVQYRTLRDLLARQEEDGSWANGDPAATALALLGFTAGGFLPAPDDEFGPCCERAARFLVGAVPPDGRLPPGTGALPAQPIVAYSLWELFWATRNPLVHNAARRATRPLLDDQGPDGLWNGDPDLSVWCACALRGAVLSEPFGLARDRPPGFEEELRGSVRRALEGFRALGPEPARRAPVVRATALLEIESGSEPDPDPALLDELSRDPASSWEALIHLPADDPARLDALWTTWFLFGIGDLPPPAYSRWLKGIREAAARSQTVIPAERSGVVDTRGKSRERGFWDGSADPRDPIVVGALYLMMQPPTRMLPRTRATPAPDSAAAPARAEDPATDATPAVFPDRSAIVRYELFRRDDGESRDIPKESGDAILYDLAEEWTTLEEIRPKPGKPGEPVGEVFPAPSDFDLYCFLGDGSSKVVEFRRAIDGKSREPQLDVLPPSFTWPRRVCKENARALLAKLDVLSAPARRSGNSRSPAEKFLLVVFGLFELAFVCAAFASLVVPRGEKTPPSRIVRVCLALGLCVVAIAVEWFCAMDTHPVLDVDWRELVFGPVVDLSSFQSPVHIVLALPLLLIPFLLVFRGVWKKTGKWLPFVLFGILLFRFTGCAYALRDI